MRPIKFRAYHLEEKRMFYPQQIVFMIDGRIMADEIIMDVSHHSYLTQNGRFGEKGSVILMRFTGLHDKNGKEIWEGDILGIYPSKIMRGEIIFKNGCFGYIQNSIFIPMDTSILYQEKTKTFCEVIGNIYENPELLKP